MSKISESQIPDHVQSITDPEERKRVLAYQFWEDEGRPEGKADEHWQRACLVLMAFEDDAEPQEPEWLQRASADDEPPPAPADDRAAAPVTHIKRRATRFAA